MILYNTLLGVCAGLGLILTARLHARLATPSACDRPTGPPLDRRLWAAALGVLGLVVALLGGLIATTWPLFVNKPINIVFGLPSLLFGLLMLGAAAYLWRTADRPARPVDLAPVTSIVFGLGLVLAACAIAIGRFNLVGGAPALEPITGRIGHVPWIENTFFVVLYGLAALGALLTPAAKLADNTAARVMRWSWTTSGVLFLLFSALNFYTHVGLLLNLDTGTNYRW